MNVSSVLVLLLRQRLNNIHISSHLLPEDTFSTVEKVKSTVESCRPLSSVIIKSQRKSNSIKCNTNTKCTDPSSQNIFLSFTHLHTPRTCFTLYLCLFLSLSSKNNYFEFFTSVKNKIIKCLIKL